MAKGSGRDLKIKKGGTTIAAVNTKGVTWQGNPIDVTSDDSDGVTTYLADKFATTSLELSVEGWLDSDVLPDIAFGTDDATKHFSDITLELLNGDVISGDFIMTNYTLGGQKEDAVTFSATFVRSGIHTVTAA